MDQELKYGVRPEGHGVLSQGSAILYSTLFSGSQTWVLCQFLGDSNFIQPKSAECLLC